MAITLTKGQQEALAAARAGNNIFVTGPGGVGKSYLSKLIIDELQAAGKTVLITASTGRAASLINGVTCHRAFGIPTSLTWAASPYIDEDSPIAAADAVLIDEVSMLRLDAFEYIVQSIEIVNSERGSERKPVQIITVGDFAQLPPVIVRPKDDTPSEAELMSDYYGFDVGAGYAFRAPGWARCSFTMITLTEVVRQEDKEMIAAENALRLGDPTALSYFEKNSRKRRFPTKTAVTYLCGKNRTAEERNAEAIAHLPGKARTYDAKISGYVTEQDKPVPDSLTLKRGARVIMAANTEHYHNGSAATVTALNTDSVTVQLDATGELVQVSYATWSVDKYIVVKNTRGKKSAIAKEQIGTYRQLPLRLGYAITIHRAQGQTIDKVVLIPEIFAYGQLYVGLSRVRTMGNLYIDGDLRKVDKLAAPDVIKFYTAIKDQQKQLDPKPVPQQKVKPVPKPELKTTHKAEKNKTETITCPKHTASLVWVFASTLDRRIKKGKGTSIIVPAELADIVINYINKIS